MKTANDRAAPASPATTLLIASPSQTGAMTAKPLEASVTIRAAIMRGRQRAISGRQSSRLIRARTRKKDCGLVAVSSKGAFTADP